MRRFLQHLGSPRLKPLVVLDLPVADLYRDHWSITGRAVPDAETPDEAVYLPGRNLLLLVKAAIWCQLSAVDALALAPLRSNPFDDATDDFFRSFESLVNRGPMGRIRIMRPFGQLSKLDVMKLGRKHPLNLTFSCISPSGDLHCGVCNKCAERQEAFRLLGESDPTHYASASTATFK